MTYLDETVAEQNGYRYTIQNGRAYYYKVGKGLWIKHIGALRKSLKMQDGSLEESGYAVNDYYKICEELVKKETKMTEKIELNLFDLNYNTINVT